MNALGRVSAARARGIVWRSLVLALGATSLGGSCNRTRIEGSITPASASLKAGDSVELELRVADSASQETEREYWTVDPGSLGKITPDPSRPRRATFEAQSPGQGSISAFAYHRPQTSPQLVARIPVTVGAVAGASPTKPADPFCVRFKTAIAGCWCNPDETEGRVAETSTAVPDEASARALVAKHLADVARAHAAGAGGPPAFDAKQLVCRQLGGGFFNCFHGLDYAATVSSVGEIYLTTCGV